MCTVHTVIYPLKLDLEDFYHVSSYWLPISKFFRSQPTATIPTMLSVALTIVALSHYLSSPWHNVHIIQRATYTTPHTWLISIAIICIQQPSYAPSTWAYPTSPSEGSP